jgi:adenine-specific DNA methylase
MKNSHGLPGTADPAALRKDLRQILERIDAEYIFETREDLAKLVNWSSTKDAPLHRWIRYREAYSPSLIDALGLGGRILDPFCGCGSMLIGAAARGRKSTGIDLNPLATFSARVKSSPLLKSEIRDLQSFQKSLPEALPFDVEPWLPDFSVAHKMFEPIILHTMLRIRSAVATSGMSKRARDFLHLCWIAILEEVGNYYKEGNGIKYRNVQRKPGKYVPREDGVWQRKRFGEDQEAFVLTAFIRHLGIMLADTVLWHPNWCEPEIIRGSSLHMPSLTNSKFDSIVFSPPYANRFDYFESMKVELWFGEFVKEKTDLQELRKSSLRSHLSSDLARDQEKFETLEQLIELMDRSASSWRMGVPNLLRGYFSDIVEVLRHCRNKLDSGACYVVVGNSAFGGVIVPSDTITAEAGLRAGFREADIWVTRHLTVAPQQRASLAGLEGFMRESVVVLRP